MGGHMRNAILMAAALPLACLFAAPAFGQDAAAAPCTKKLTMLNEIQMESKGTGPSLVPVEINGTRQNLTFATAGTTTQLTEQAAKDLKLEITRGDTVLYDDNGTAYRNQVTVAKLAMGSLQGSNVHIPVSPAGRGGRGGGGGDEGGFGGGGFGGGRGGSGLFSLNHMLPYDVDVDFGNDKLRFFDQDHCPGGVLYWQASFVGVAPITVEAGRVTIPAELDGKSMTAVIDTAAMVTSIKMPLAEKLMGLEPVPDDKRYTHTFASLRLGSLGLRNISVTVVPVIVMEGASAVATARNRSIAVQSAVAKPEIIIGMDLLRKLHIYMAFGEKKLFLTPASARPADTAAAAPAAAPK